MPAPQTGRTLVVVIPFVSDTYVYDSAGALTALRVSNFINTKQRKSLRLASALDDAEVPGLHHGEVGESAAHSVMRKAVCACEDVCTMHEQQEQCIYSRVEHLSFLVTFT